MTSPHGSMAESLPVADAIVSEQPGDHDGSGDVGALTNNDILRQIPAKLDAVEKQLRSLSHKPRMQSTASVTTSESGEGSSVIEIEDKRLKQHETWPLPVSAHVAMCNFQQFKTAVYAEETAVCAIDALVWTSTLSSDIDNFMASLKRPSMRRDFHVERAKQLDVSDAEALDAFPPNETWIQDVRVNSHAVLSVLDRFSFDEGILVKEPHIFHRPFMYFIENYEKIHEELLTIESQKRTIATPAHHSTIPQEVDQSLDAVGKCPETESIPPEISPEDGSKDNDIARAAVELRCFCDFVEKFIMPKYEALEDNAIPKGHKIHYDDLAFIFRPGELIYVPASTTQPDELRGSFAQRRSAGQQTIFRLELLEKSSRIRRATPEMWSASCYYIEFDGESYGATGSHTVDIPVFSEARHITELPVYPARFMDNYEDALKEAKEYGEKMVDLLSESAQHAHYSGWTLTNGPTGTGIEDSRGDSVRFPEHIESDIIVDYDEAFKHNPRWRPVKLMATVANRNLETDRDTFPLVRSSTYPPYELVAQYDERIALDPMRYRQCNENLHADGSILDDQSYHPVRPQDLALLPRRLFAYSLWDRKFVQIDSHFVNRRAPEGREGQSFQQLQIEQQSKDVIESLLYNHFNDMKAERAGVVVESQDLIRGKGRGVSILLHGKPGVGKTATAEAVAEKWNRPLFPITCGDLGYQADTVETNMNEIFRLAHLWGCILLLDEADIFITQRTNQELQRNGLVSIFLRMLEYYNGILFLTTNRTGVLDEAIKSRIHLHLGFDDLNEHQTVEIFKNNIGRLRTRDQQRMDAMTGHRALQIDVDGILKFAEDHYRSCNTMGRWNGRQIRNAFVVASSLANFEAQKRSPDWQAQLRAEHFQTVLEATLQYDRYRQSIFTVSDDAMAFSRMERAEPAAPPAPSGPYGYSQNGAPFFPQQQQQQQQAGVPTRMQYGGATGAAFAQAAMRPPSTSSFPYNTGFAPGTPGPAYAGLYAGQQAFSQGLTAPSAPAQGQMYSQQPAQPGVDTAASAQGLGSVQEQSPSNPGGSSNLRTGAVESTHVGGVTTGPGGWPSSQGQAQPPHMQYGGR